MTNDEVGVGVVDREIAAFGGSCWQKNLQPVAVFKMERDEEGGVTSGVVQSSFFTLWHVGECG